MAKIPQKFVPETPERFVPLRRRLANFGPLSAAASAAGSALSGVGRALQGLGSAFLRLKATSAAAAQTDFDVEYYKLLGDVEDELRRATREAPEGGAGLSEHIGEIWKKRTEEFLARVPQELRSQYAARLANYQRQLEETTFKIEEKLHDTKVARNLQEIVRQHQISVENNPESLKSVEQQLTSYVNSLPLPEDKKAELIPVVKKALQSSAAVGRLISIYTDKSIEQAEKDFGGIDAILARIHKIEGTGKNPDSSAAYHFQFTRETWLRAVKEYFPDKVRGLTDAQILELRKNKEFAWAVARKFTLENIDRLQRAGIDITPGRVYLAHFAGAAGAIKVIRAPDDTPVEAVLGKKAVAANRFLRGKTVGWLERWADRKMHGKGSSLPESLFADLDQLSPFQRLSLTQQAFRAIKIREAEFVNDLITQIARGEISDPNSYIKSLLDAGHIDGVDFLRVKSIIERLSSESSGDGADKDSVVAPYLTAMREEGLEVGFQRAIEDFREGKLDARQFGKIQREYNLLKSLEERDDLRALMERVNAGKATEEEVDRLDVDPETKIKLKGLVRRSTELNKERLAIDLATDIANGRLTRDQLTERFKAGEISIDVYNRVLALARHFETGESISQEEAERIFAEALREASDPNSEVTLADLIERLNDQLGTKFTIGKAKQLAKAYEEKVRILEYEKPDTIVPYDTEGKKTADLWLERMGLNKALMSTDRKQVMSAIAGAIAPRAVEGKPLPPKLGAILKAKLQSDNDAHVVTALEAFTYLQSINKTATQQLLGDEDYNKFYILSAMSAYGFTPARIKDVRDELDSPARFISSAKEDFKRAHGKDIKVVVNEFINDEELDVHPDKLKEVIDEYAMYYAIGYKAFGDAAKAKTVADRLIKSYWSKTEIDGVDMFSMRLPPSLVAPNEGILREWIDGPLRESIKRLEEQAGGDVLSVFLVPDRKTVYKYLNGAEGVSIPYHLGAVVELEDGSVKFFEMEEPVVFDVGEVSRRIHEKIKKNREAFEEEQLMWWIAP